jgi:arylsulfatase A-like enzyme
MKNTGIGMDKKGPYLIAAWSALIFGIIEGVLLNISRMDPVILAPYKTSAHILWVSPLLDIFLFIVATPLFLLAIKIIGRWFTFDDLLVVYGIFSFGGAIAVISALKIIHPISAIIISLGLSTIIVRSLREKKLTALSFLNKNWYWIPVTIALLMIVVTSSEVAKEAWNYNKLPDARTGVPNVLIIVMDTVRYDRFNQEGESLTPNIDRIGSMGANFENAWPTTSWTLPSHGSILTSYNPEEHGADWPGLKLDEKYPTLAEYFANQGYVTGAFSGNSAWVTPEYLGRGFLRFDVYIYQDFIRRTSLGRILNKLVEPFGLHYAGYGKKAPASNDQFLGFLDDYPDRPFFALLNYMDVNQALHNKGLNHGFWEATPPVEEIVQAYDLALHTLDNQIGALLDNLEKRDILDDTLVFITSDHGESFGAEYSKDHNPEGHGTSLYVEQVRVPLFVIYRGHVAPDQRISTNVSLRQIPATIIQLLGLENSPFQASPLPLQAVWENTNNSFAEDILLTLNYNDHNIQSLVWDNWKYIHNVNDEQKKDELYDLIADPAEEFNLAGNHPAISDYREKLFLILGQSKP